MIKNVLQVLTAFLFLIAGTESKAQWNLTGNSNATTTSVLGTANAIPLSLITKNTKRLVIDTLGRIGIGTSTPANILTVKGTGSTPAASWVSAGAPLFVGFGETTVGNADFILSMASAAANARPVFVGRRSRGTLAVPGAVAANDQIMSFLASAYDGSIFQNPATIDFFVDGTPSAGSVPGRISFVTGSNSGNRAERLKIGSTGNISINNNQLYVQQTDGAVGIGTASPVASALIDMTSTTKGLLVPRMTKSQKNTIASPATGLLLYQTDDIRGFYYSYGGAWKPLKVVDSVNSFLGYRSGDLIAGGIFNTAIGNYTLQSLTTGDKNTAAGHNSLVSNTVGIENAAFGADAMNVNDSGNYNAALGNSSLTSNRNGNYNTGIGFSSLYFQSGDNNSALGFSAGDYTTGTAEGTFLGTLTQAGADLSNVTAVGFNAIVPGSNSVRIGNTAVTSIGGQVGWSSFSDGRFKNNVKENVPGLEFISKLRPVTYNLNIKGMDNAFEAITGTGKSTLANGSKHEKPLPSATEIKAKEEKAKIIYTGFIAQEVDQAAKDLNYEFSGVDKPKNKNDFFGLRYSEFVVPLVKSVQELNQQNEAKDATIQEQNKKITNLEERLSKLEAMIGGSNAKTMQNVELTSASIEQNVPNPPVNNNTKISYNIPNGSTKAELVITDVYGKKVKEINLSGTGKSTLNVNTTGLSAGTYSYTLFVNGKATETKKMVVAGN